MIKTNKLSYVGNGMPDKFEQMLLKIKFRNEVP